MKLPSWKYRPIILSICLSLFFSHASATEECHTYIESDGVSTRTYNWKMTSLGEKVEVESVQGQNIFYCLSTTAGATREWRYSTGSEYIRIRRQNNMFFLHVQEEERELIRKIEIDDAPWFQALSYSLRQFISSRETEMEFWHIRQDTLEPVKLSARKLQKEMETKCNGEPAAEVEIRPVGMLGRFWHASYWFRKKDNVFCRYEGRHGIWGAPLTVISLQITE